MRTLESKNKLLEAEIDVLKSRHVRPSGLRQLYESQLKDLNRVAEQMRVERVREVISHDCNIVVHYDRIKSWCGNTGAPFHPIYKDMSLAAKEAMLGQFDMLKAKYDEAVDARKKAEHDIETVRLVRNN